MKEFASLFALLVIIIPWIAGLVIAKGAWQTVSALFPPYAWYLVIEKAMMANGLV